MLVWVKLTDASNSLHKIASTHKQGEHLDAFWSLKFVRYCTFQSVIYFSISHHRTFKLVVKLQHTPCFQMNKIWKKFFSISDAGFNTKLMHRIQKYALYENPTSPFWGQSKTAQKSAAKGAVLAVLFSR